MEQEKAIAALRDSVVAIMRIRQTSPERKKHGKVFPTAFQLGFVGTAFCVVENRFFVTAHHVFNERQPRNVDDKFYVFAVPGNADAAYPFPVMGYPHADDTTDLAIIEIGQGQPGSPQIPALRFRTRPIPDGSRVVTCGFPAPVIAGASIGPNGTFLGGQFFLKSHANEGIVAAQYRVGGHRMFEFNVGWYNGESGGPVMSLEDGAVVAIMQGYRNIQAPHGTVAGPHMARPVALIADKLIAAGAVDVAAQAEGVALTQPVPKS